ncbi:unnamed protein product [Oreochromis niloticus]|nr:unnamed protein product [Mustela putorius furo]
MWRQWRNFYLAIIFHLSGSSAAADAQIRLIDPDNSGATLCYGRVEIYNNNRWGTVCHNGWDLNDAEVVCRQLDCGLALNATRSAHFGEGTGQIWLAGVSCSGSESSLTDCQHRGFDIVYCGHHEDAGVICSEIRLTGSQSTRCSGRVEIYHNNRWGTVCDDGWDINDAEVVCRELGCGSALDATESAHFGEGTGQIWLDDVACSGSESSLTECQHGGFGTHDCTHLKDAGVICSGVPIRLAGSGSTQCSGRVEIYRQKTWGTVCDHGWDINDAEVVCRQLDCGSALKATRSAQFGEGTGDIWLNEVSCSGSESSLADCQHRGFGTHSCGHGEDAGVICSGIRLAGHQSQCSGRVEIYHNKIWGTVCDHGWSTEDAEVVCRHLDCGPALNATQSAHFGQGTGQIWLDEVSCSGSETSLTDCQHRGFGTHSCGHGEDAGVICSGIRLSGRQSGRCSGRVEIYHQKRWGTVCDDGWDLNDAEVVCRHLDCGTALAAPKEAHFGEGSGPIWLDGVACSGSERSIIQCQHRGSEKNGCAHHKDAGVICSGARIRLTGSTRCSGRAEIFYNNTWGTVCDDGWDLNDAEVVCRELNCGTALNATQSAHFGEGRGSIWLDDVDCSGSERSLTRCQHRGFGKHDCTHSKDAGVVCSGVPVRLSGSTLCSGRVEIFYNNIWGTVCHDNWDMNDAEVVCRELGCGTAQSAAVSARFGEGSGSIWLDDVSCSGSERSLTECQHRGFGTHDCTHSKDAGVVCSVILPKPRIFMIPAGKVDRRSDVSITCSISPQSQQLLQGEFTLKQISGSFSQKKPSTTNSATFKILQVDFDNDGLYQCEYSYGSSISTSDSVTVSVTVSMQHPRISVTSPNGGLAEVPEGREIMKGYSFIFTCSKNDRYSGGVFNLIYSGSNMKHMKHTKTSVNNSASFSFPVADFEHEGRYSCVYEITLTEGTFTSPETELINISVIYSRTPILRYVLLPLVLLLENIALHFYYKVIKKQKSDKKKNDETDVSRSEEVEAEEETVQEIE